MFWRVGVGGWWILDGRKHSDQESLNRLAEMVGDLGDAAAGHGDQWDGGHRPAALAEAHVEVEQGTLAETIEQPAVARLGGAVADGAVVEDPSAASARVEARRAVTT